MSGRGSVPTVYIDPVTAERSYVVRRVKETFRGLNSQLIAYRLAYASFVSLKHKFLYIETPKVACTTIKNYLRDLCGASQIEYQIGELRETRRDMFVHVRSNVPFLSLMDLDEETQRLVLDSPEFLRFCIVRNPYSRIVSAWRNKALFCEPGYERIYQKMLGGIPPIRDKRMLSFEEFLQFVEDEPNVSSCNPHWRRQIDLLYMPAISYTHVGKLERISETEHVLRDHLGGSHFPKFGASNASGGENGAVLTERTAERVFALYSADFETFAYSRESWRQHALTGNPEKSLPRYKEFDEIVERNLIISLLYDRYASLESDYLATYRFSLMRLRHKLQNLGFRFARRKPRTTPRGVDARGCDAPTKIGE